MIYSLLENKSSWMKGIPDSTPLSYLSIPGTHQSCCREDVVINGGAMAWSDCQVSKATIPTQLKDGIRYLDLRCMAVDGKYFEIMHGNIDYKNTLDSVMDECAEFLNQNKSETILMRIKQEGYNIVSDNEFIKIFDNYVKKHSSKIHQSSLIPDLGDVRGKIVIISNVSGLKGIQWGGIKHQDVSKTSIANKKTLFLDHLNNAVKDNGKSLYINHSSIQAQGLHTVGYYAHYMNAFLLEELMTGLGTRDVNNSKNESPHFGIIAMDYYRGDVVDQIIKQNIVSDVRGMPIIRLQTFGFDDHHLTASRYYDGSQRTVYCIETYKSDDQRYWVKIEINSTDFYLFNTYYKEFLYASSIISSGDRRHILTDSRGAIHDGAIWRLSGNDLSKARIMNVKFREYLYISGFSSMNFTEECNCLVGGRIPDRSEWNIVNILLQ